MKSSQYIGISGAGTALITPFAADGSVDLKALEELVENNILSGIHFLCVLGTTAETPTLSSAEQAMVRTTVVQTVAGRVPILLGYGSNNTADIIRRMRADRFEGIDALLMVTPYYNKPSQEGLYRHFRAISEASPMPIVLYNVPSRTGVNMTADTTIRLARDCHNIIGIKEASGNLEQIQQIIDQRPEGFRVLSGDDALTAEIMSRGGDGVISVASNIVPESISGIVLDLRDGIISDATVKSTSLTPLFRLLFREGNPVGVKGMLSILGRCENVVRLPLVPASEALLDDMRLFLQNL